MKKSLFTCLLFTFKSAIQVKLVSLPSFAGSVFLIINFFLQIIVVLRPKWIKQQKIDYTRRKSLSVQNTKHLLNRKLLFWIVVSFFLIPFGHQILDSHRLFYRFTSFCGIFTIEINNIFPYHLIRFFIVINFESDFAEQVIPCVV
eukprot:TRINITY_DN1043_c0_g1_i3.p6 TRINITY_DN1043_c0_g1~~TRINITY_DN1043_c0_g1_i3.p6  ORF type:complete len:145 (+),score=0.28 TRINITY_DN1043_c0_g1_i3:225-659(+)